MNYLDVIIEKLKKVDKVFAEKGWDNEYEPRVLLREVINELKEKEAQTKKADPG